MWINERRNERVSDWKLNSLIFGFSHQCSWKECWEKKNGLKWPSCAMSWRVSSASTFYSGTKRALESPSDRDSARCFLSLQEKGRQDRSLQLLIERIDLNQLSITSSIGSSQNWTLMNVWTLKNVIKLIQFLRSKLMLSN